MKILSLRTVFFSRAFCNFVFPNEIQRPLPNTEQDLQTTLQTNMDEDVLDNVAVEEKINNIDGRYNT